MYCTATSSKWVKTQTLVPVKLIVNAADASARSQLFSSTVLYSRHLCVWVFLALESSVGIELQEAISHYKVISSDE